MRFASCTQWTLYKSIPPKNMAALKSDVTSAVLIREHSSHCCFNYSVPHEEKQNYVFDILLHISQSYSHVAGMIVKTMWGEPDSLIDIFTCYAILSIESVHEISNCLSQYHSHSCLATCCLLCHSIMPLYMVSAGRCDGMFTPTNPRK